MCFASVIWVFDSIASNLHVFIILLGRFDDRLGLLLGIFLAMLCSVDSSCSSGYSMFERDGEKQRGGGRGKESKGCLADTSKMQGHLRSWSKTFEEQVSNICNPSHGSLSLKVLANVKKERGQKN